MNRVIAKYQDDLELQECIKSAYADFKILLKDVFVNLGRFPLQMTFYEFTYLFICYDWQDVFETLEEIENLPYMPENESNYCRIIDYLLSCRIPQISFPKDNSYYKVWAGITNEFE